MDGYMKKGYTTYMSENTVEFSREPLVSPVKKIGKIPPRKPVKRDDGTQNPLNESVPSDPNAPKRIVDTNV